MKGAIRACNTNMAFNLNQFIQDQFVQDFLSTNFRANFQALNG